MLDPYENERISHLFPGENTCKLYLHQTGHLYSKMKAATGHSAENASSLEVQAEPNVGVNIRKNGGLTMIIPELPAGN